jgi:hypothetical protein
VAESRKAMKHQREQMNLHGNKIAELEDAGKKVPPALRAKYNLAKASYNSHRKAINDATGVMKSPVMQAAREAGRAEERKNQEKRAVQRGEERVARAGARDRALTPKEQAGVEAKVGRKSGPSKVAEGLQREQMRAERTTRLQADYDKLLTAHKAAKEELKTHRGRDLAARVKRQQLANAAQTLEDKKDEAFQKLLKAKRTQFAAEKAASTGKK